MRDRRISNACWRTSGTRARDNLVRRASHDVEIRELRHSAAGETAADNHRQRAKAGILGKNGEEGVGDARTKPVAEHDAVDIAGVEMFGCRLDAQGANQRHALAQCDGELRIGSAAPDQKDGCVLQGIAVSQADVGEASAIRRSTVVCRVRTRSAAVRRASRRSSGSSGV